MAAMTSENIREYIEQRVTERRKSRATMNQKKIAENARDLVDRGMYNTSLRSSFVLKVLIDEGQAIVDDYLEIGVQSFWMAHGDVAQHEQEWLLQKCDKVAQADPKDILGDKVKFGDNFPSMSEEQIRLAYQKRLVLGKVGRRKLDILIGDKKLQDMQKYREVPFYNRLWWQIIFGSAAVVGCARVIIELLS